MRNDNVVLKSQTPKPYLDTPRIYDQSFKKNESIRQLYSQPKHDYQCSTSTSHLPQSSS